VTHRCEEECKKAVQRYREEEAGRAIPKDAKIFVILGHYDDVRQELLRRGWFEHEHHCTGAKTDANKFKSNAFHLIYTTKAKDVFRIHNLAPSQHLNHFEGTKALTTKVGLTHNMKNLIWKHTIDIDCFFP
jgi:tubulin monoglycylase TTLL3/8